MMMLFTVFPTVAVSAIYFLLLGPYEVSSEDEEWPKCDSGLLGGSYSLPHSKYCDRYFSCERGNISLHTCLYGLAYKTFLGCMPWHSVDCTQYNDRSYYEELYPEIQPPSQIFVTLNPDGSVDFTSPQNLTLETSSKTELFSTDQQVHKPLAESTLPSTHFSPTLQQPNRPDTFGLDASLDRIVLIPLAYLTAPFPESERLQSSFNFNRRQSSASPSLKNPSSIPTEPSITVTSRPFHVRDPPANELITVDGVVYKPEKVSSKNTFLKKYFFTLHIKKPAAASPSVERRPEDKFDFDIELTDPSPDFETSDAFTETSSSSDLIKPSDKSDLYSIHPILRQFVLGARIFPNPESLPVVDFDCPIPNGVFADPKGCGRFFKCENGVAYSDRCFPGLFFQENTKLCKQGTRKEVKVCQQQET